MYWISEKSGWPEIDPSGFVASVHRMLKPGGRLLIVDHNAAAGTGRDVAGTLHRLNADWARQSLTSRGFEFRREYDGLRNPRDMLDKGVSDPAAKGRTDRYVMLFERR